MKLIKTSLRLAIVGSFSTLLLVLLICLSLNVKSYAQGMTNCESILLIDPILSSNSFSFSVDGIAEGETWGVYSSTDLENWTLAGTVTMSGTPPTFTDDTIADIPYRFYKLNNSNCCSQAIGFVRLAVGPEIGENPGTNSLIADQLDAPANTLNGLFNPMADGTYLPDGTQIAKWNGSSYVYYTWSAGAWTPNGNATLNPGEGAFVINPISSPITVSFVGFVPEGNLSLSIPGGQFNLVSSQLPKAGGITSALGYVPNTGDSVQLWTGTGYTASTYIPFTIPRWYPSEPVLTVGEGFFISSTNNVWQQSFFPCD